MERYIFPYIGFHGSHRVQNQAGEQEARHRVKDKRQPEIDRGCGDGKHHSEVLLFHRQQGGDKNQTREGERGAREGEEQPHQCDRHHLRPVSIHHHRPLPGGQEEILQQDFQGGEHL